MQSPTVLFFDVAETLIDLAEPVPRVYTRFAKAAGLALDEESVSRQLKEAWVSLPDPTDPGDKAERDWWRELVREAIGRSNDQARRFCRSEDFNPFFDRLFDYYAKAEAWRVYDDTVPALVKARSAGKRLGVISNFDDRLHPILDQLELSAYFEVIINSSSAGHRKPQAEIFNLACEKMSASPSECLHVGDSYERDYRGAVAAGLQAHHLKRPDETLLSVDLLS